MLDEAHQSLVGLSEVDRLFSMLAPVLGEQLLEYNFKGEKSSTARMATRR